MNPPRKPVPAAPASGALDDPYWQHWYPLHVVARARSGAEAVICTPRRSS